MEQIHHKIFLAGVMMFAAAVIFVAGVWYLVTSQNSKAPVAEKSAITTLAPGQKNPAADLVRVSSIFQQRVTGPITAVGSGSIPVAYGTAKTPTIVIVDSNTAIYKAGAQKDPVTYANELKDFNAKLLYAANDTSNIYIAPDSFVHVPLTLSDLTVGDNVSYARKLVTA